MAFKYELDEFSDHEVLDRAFVVLDSFYSYVLEHEAVEVMPPEDEVRVALEQAGDALVKAYQLLGARYLH